MEHYEAWKDEEPIWCKTEISLSKNVKFHFYPAVGAISRFYQQFNCKNYVWSWCETKLIFVLVISIESWLFRKKKNLNSKKFAHAGIFCSWYRFWHQINLKLMSQIHDFCRSNSIPSIFYGLQFSHYDSSKLLKNFMKSNLLPLWS